MNAFQIYTNEERESEQCFKKANQESESRLYSKQGYRFYNVPATL